MKLVVAGVFAMALAVRVAFVVCVPGWQMTDVPGGDPIDYHSIGVSLSEGTGFAKPWEGGGPHTGELRPTAIRAPLWPALLGVLYSVTGPDPTAGRALLCVLDALACALLAVLGGWLVSRRVGLVAGAMAAAYPPMLVSVDSLMAEAVFTVLVVAALVAAAWVVRSPTAGRSLVLGLVLGLATLARPNGLFIGGGLALWLLVHVRSLGRRRAVALAASCLFGLAVVVAPWIVWTSVRLGEPVPVTTDGGPVVAGTYSDRMLDLDRPDWGGWDVVLVVTALHRAPDELAWDRELRDVGYGWIRDHPASAAKIVGLHVVRYFDLYWSMDDRLVTVTPTPWRWFNAACVVAWWLVAIAAVVGVVRATSAGIIAQFVPGLVAVAVLAASGVFLVAATRYRVPSEPVVLLLAAVAVVGPSVQGRRATT